MQNLPGFSWTPEVRNDATPRRSAAKSELRVGRTVPSTIRAAIGLACIGVISTSQLAGAALLEGATSFEQRVSHRTSLGHASIQSMTREGRVEITRPPGPSSTTPLQLRAGRDIRCVVDACTTNLRLAGRWVDVKAKSGLRRLLGSSPIKCQRKRCPPVISIAPEDRSS